MLIISLFSALSYIENVKENPTDMNNINEGINLIVEDSIPWYFIPSNWLILGIVTILIIIIIIFFKYKDYLTF